MTITLIGTVNMGSALTKQLTRAGHEVRLTGRDLGKARALATTYPSAISVAPVHALGDSETVIVATYFAAAVPALRSLGPLDGKALIDITNPVTADFSGLTIGHDTSAAEDIAKALPAATVVKAFNTLFAQVTSDGPAFGEGVVAPVFYAGDNAPAKQRVHSLISSMGFQPIDAGNLKNARYLEPLGGLNIYFGYAAGHGTQIAPTWLKRS